MLCKSDNPATAKADKLFVSIVFNRDLNRAQIFEFKPSVFEQLREYNGNKHWGSLINYDVEVDRLKSRGFKTFKVTPLPKEPLTKEELALVAEFSARVDLNRHTAPMDNAGIEERIAKANGETYVPRSLVQASIASTTQAVAEDPDFSFT